MFRRFFCTMFPGLGGRSSSPCRQRPVRRLRTFRPAVMALEDRLVMSIAATPWPTLGQNLQHTGVSPYSASQTGTLAWTGTVNNYTEGIVIGTNGIYTSGETLIAYNWDGTVQWTKGGAYPGVPAIDSNGTIYVRRQFGSTGYVDAFDPSGNLLWESLQGTANGWIYVASFGIGSDGTVYAADETGDGILRALDPATGAVKWQFNTGAQIESSPTVGADGTIYIGSDNGRLYALNPNGTQKWRTTPMSGGVWGGPAIGTDGTIYAVLQGKPNSAFGGALTAVSPTGRQKWTVSANVSDFAWPAVDNARGHIYVSAADGLSAFSLSGAFQWKYTTGSVIYGEPAIGADGTVYIAASGGSAYALTPGGSLLWQGDIGGSLVVNGVGRWTSPAINSDGTVYVGGVRLHAFKDPAPLVAATTSAQVNGSVLNAGLLGGAGGTAAPAGSLLVSSNAASNSAPPKGLPDAVLIQVLTENTAPGDVSAAAAASAKGARSEGLDQAFADLNLGTLPGLPE
jgi:outer membrane protein assembly factor BamB